LCYTLFAPISAVFAEGGDSVVRAGFLVLFIREKYRKKIISFPFALMQKEQKIKPARFPHPLCQLAENTIRVVPHQCPTLEAINIIDEANVPPSSDAPDVFSGKLSFTANAAGTRRPPTAQLIGS